MAGLLGKTWGKKTAAFTETSRKCGRYLGLWDQDRPEIQRLSLISASLR
jgi:hypothetical protein